MADDDSRTARSLAWQQRYLVPVLVVVGLVAVAATWAAGGIAWWIAVPVLALAVVALVGLVRPSGNPG